MEIRCKERSLTRLSEGSWDQVFMLITLSSKYRYSIFGVIFLSHNIVHLSVKGLYKDQISIRGSWDKAIGIVKMKEQLWGKLKEGQ